ncbi:hypothetical protein BXZ70DRAFT_776144 [Cristinia sonorae]|uniref:Uncharacterized protein n=1 Tax=Cristinia sonorae TaxID=1940300 RepID=A0A8K0XRX8_9AGAR|nr:hypothetical protein BXZ70DRAFT_776144 [Cristinia sonorae]
MDIAMDTLPKSLIDLLGGFSSNLPPNTLKFPRDVSLSDAQDFLVHKLLLDPHFVSYPASKQYQALFWKWVIQNLEDALANSSEDIELDSRIYEHYISLVSSVSKCPAVGVEHPPESYTTYFWHDRSKYARSTLMESRKIIESGTTGLTTWPASMVLANFLTMHRETVQGKSIVELGSGIGLLGIIMATVQVQSQSSSTLCLTDGRPDVLRRCQSNLSLPCSM